jgi:hypothetical protein
MLSPYTPTTDPYHRPGRAIPSGPYDPAVPLPNREEIYRDYLTREIRDLSSAYLAEQNQNKEFMDWQSMMTNQATDALNRGISALTGLGNFNFQPYLNASRGAIQNATTRGVQASLAAANAASGGRGLGGSFAAGMAQRAVQGAYGQQAAAEAELQKGLMDAQSRLNLGLMSALPSLYGGQAEVIASQVYPTTDFLGWYHTQQGQELYDLMLQQLQQSIDSPLNDPLNQLIWAIVTSALPGSGILGR